MCGVVLWVSYYEWATLRLFAFELRDSIKAMRRGKFRRGVVLQQDNARVHASQIVMHSVWDCGLAFLSHPPYSQDLAPSD